MKMKIAILLGSVRKERQSDRLAFYLKNQLIEKGVTVNFIDLQKYPLPIFGSEVSEIHGRNVAEISNLLKSSQCVIIITPEYHSNISAALKNVIEYCGADLMGKVVGITSASATKFGGLHASNILQITLLNLGAYPSLKRLLVPEIHLAFNEIFQPLQIEIKEQAEKFLNELINYTDVLKNDVSQQPLSV